MALPIHTRRKERAQQQQAEKYKERTLTRPVRCFLHIWLKASRLHRVVTLEFTPPYETNEPLQVEVASRVDVPLKLLSFFKGND